MDNNYQSNNNYNPNQSNTPYANPYPTQAPENTQYANPYPAQTPENIAYNNPYATNTQNTPYNNPYVTAPQESVPYANPYAVPAPVPPKKSNKGLLIGLIAGGVVILGIILALVLYFTSDSYKYGKAEDFLAEGKYDEAITTFEELGDYKDSAEKIDECKYAKACFLLRDGNYDDAIEIFYELENFNDSENKIIECNRRMLYDYLDENGEVSLYTSGYTYKLYTDGDNISLGLTKSDPSQKFSLTFDMTSDEGHFFYGWYSNSTDTTEGYCILSELETSGNSLDIDKFTGSSYMMQDLTDSTCDMSCMYFDNLLDDTDLDLTPYDLGFTSIY